MSGKGNMESNNCTTKTDVYEAKEFIDEYEGDEYITLSELVFPSCASTEVMETIMDLPSDQTEDRVVKEDVNNSLSPIFDDIQEINTTMKQDDSQVTTEPPIKVIKKRGRKKKNSIESMNNSLNVSQEKPYQPDNSDLNYDMIIGEDSMIEPLPQNSTRKRVKKSSITEDIKAITPIPPRKRGRPRKNPILPTNTDCITSTIENTKPINKEHVSPQTQQKSKRGRKKKLPIDDQSSSKMVNENCDITSSDFTRNNTQETSNDQNVSNDMVNPDRNEVDHQGQVDNTEQNRAEIGEITSNKNVENINKATLKSKYSDIWSTPISQTKLIKKPNKSKVLIPTKRKGKLKKQNVSGGKNLDSIDSTAKDDEDGMDDLCLSKLKKSIENVIDVGETSINEQHPDITTTVEDSICTDKLNKRNIKMPTMKDFEYDIENIGQTENKSKESINLIETPVDEESLLEETSRRPVRRRAKKTLHYEQESDEDPFANMESSDDEPRRGKKGSRNYSDDEYIPGMEQGRRPSKFSDSEVDLPFEFHNKQKKKRLTKSPKKKDKKIENESTPDITLNDLDDDIEGSIETNIIKCNEDTSSKWGSTNEFESFLAKKVGTELFIKKAESNSIITPLQIPVLDINESKKSEEISTRTNTITTKYASTQTDTINEISMKDQVKLTAEQSAKACEFLTSSVKTTVELGQLMTQKSEDFIKKKINTTHVTDTFKMDYCVKKAFLLIKLTRNNLIQMEEDLSKQYVEFLRQQNLMQHIEEQKVITPNVKYDSDSDCEIIEVISDEKKPENKPKSAFNPKTVFLNKELSIKIAKKPSAEPKVKEKLNIKGRHTVWINDSIMVKKVKPNQSFLAQDSRNKKPPDTYFVMLKIVNDFFETYKRQTALSICAPFVSFNWITLNKVYCCYYSTEITVDCSSNLGQLTDDNPTISESTTNIKNPKPLLTLCVMVLKNHLKFDNKGQSPASEKHESNTTRLRDVSDRLDNASCINTKQENLSGELTSLNPEMYILESQSNSKTIKSLSTLSLLELQKHIKCKSNEVSEEQLTSEDDHTSKKYIARVKSNVESVLVNSQFDKQLGQKLNSVNNLSLQMLCYRKILEFLFKIPKNLVIQSRPKMSVKSLNKEEFTTNINNDKVKSLSLLCLKVIQNIQYSQKNISHVVLYNPNSLLSIALDHFRIKTYKPKRYHNIQKLKLSHIRQKKSKFIKVKTLSSLCLKLLNSSMHRDDYNILNTKHKYKPECNNSVVLPFTKICLDTINMLMNEPIHNENKKQQISDRSHSMQSEMFEMPLLNTNFETNSSIKMSITINDINSVSEETFNNDYNSFNVDDIYDDTECRFEDDELHRDIEENVYDDYGNDFQEATNDSNEWVSHIQMGELRSCVDTRNNSDDNLINMNLGEIQSKQQECIGLSTNIKLEPIEDIPEIPDPDLKNIKTEPLDIVSQTDSSIRITAKIEDTSQEHGLSGSSYDVDAFEAFVASSKLMNVFENYSSNGENEIYSQSCFRVRRQYEPDFNNDEDNFGDYMDLLVPQTLDQVKDRLMDSSSDEESQNKKNDKKKYTKKKGKLKKISKEIIPLKNKQVLADDVAILTKKMKDKIRQEYKCSNVSDIEDMPLIFRRDKDKKTYKKDQEIESVHSDKINISPEKESEKNTRLKSTDGNEIQCNDVDSTENIETNDNIKYLDKRSLRKNSKLIDQKTDSSKTNDICDTKNSKSMIENAVNESKAQIEAKRKLARKYPSKLVDMAQPIELLECEPTLPIFDTQADKNYVVECDETLSCYNNASEDENKNITLRNGWKCYTIDHTDTKLYQYAFVDLEKLPESFVETYLRYINLDKDENDVEIDRLTNLQTLNRTQGKERNQLKTKYKSIPNDTSKIELAKVEHEDNVDEECNEFSPSEDEYDNTDEVSQSVQESNTENEILKRLLMNDDESESENLETSKSDLEKKEPDAETPKVKRKIGPKSKCKVVKEEADVDQKIFDSKIKIKKEEGGIVKEKVKIEPASKVKKEECSDSLLLTADKMMNSELALLHAPVADKGTEQSVIVKESTKKYNTRNLNKSPKGQTTTVHIRKDDDSSSEEEKQWVTTKEKLLKRLEKKQENNIDDAKRAKIISEFIEKRGDGPVQKLLRVRPRRPRSKKKLLERRKQMKALERELFGDDASQSRKHSQSYAKGRRNIRKVIDKKSLSATTVLANMHEFERKRRLSMRQVKLRETLNCEEDVNVVVINDELCLEYDFEKNQPGVTVHPFFTKVMKDHQYEGVKFMWDACFETVETVQKGGGGGGCILAHCMGLGKTLQVLALLHTVLTHPGVGMRRVLVCCPLSTVLNWVDEIHKWIGPVTAQIKVFELSKLKKTYERAYQLEDWYSGGGIFIIGYELFRSLTTLNPICDDVRPTIVNKIRTALLDPGPDIIICDEGHLLKNDMSLLAVAMSRVATKRRIVLTGTPMQNNLREYYCMVNFIKPHLLGTYPEYSNRFENPIMNGQHRDSQEDDIKLMKTRTHVLHKVLEGCLQRQEASVLYPYLPKKYEYTVFISLTTCQWDLYKYYMKTFSNVAKQNILKDFHILQKIWSHPQVLHNFQTRAREVEGDNKIKAEKLEDELVRDDLTATEDMKPNPTDVWWLQYLAGGQMLEMLDSSHKFLVVFSLLEECVVLGDKVLIFSTSLYTLDALEYFLRRINKWSLGQEYYRLDGSVPAEVRQKWCREFNLETNTNTKLFLISTRAGCLGLNMTAANRVIILDTSWNPAHDIQSIFRVYRFGQKKDCFIYRLVALGTMEQKMYERSVTKQAVACRVVDEQQIDRHYNLAELSELYRYDEEGSSVAAGLAADVHDAVLLRVATKLRARSGALHAVREHDSLLRDTAEARLPEHERAEAWQQFQQEHVNPQMQPPVKLPKKFRVKLNNAPSAEEDIKTETASPDNPPESKPVKGKRGRPPKDKNLPSTSKQLNITLDAGAQTSILNQLRDILIEHQVKSTEPSDITHMVGEFHKYIATSREGDMNANPVIQSIAKVLHPVKQGATIPHLTDVYPDERGSGQGTQDNIYQRDEPESILGDSDPYSVTNTDISPTMYNKTIDMDVPIKQKRRWQRVKIDKPSLTTRGQTKMLVNENQNSESGTSINLTSVNEYCNSIQTIDMTVEKPKGKRGRKRKSDQTMSVKAVSTPFHSIQETDDGMDDNSILVSDDEPASKQPQTCANAVPEQAAPKMYKIVQNDVTSTPELDQEVIPLSKLLLTNESFIKIVAHMYVSGNPILDEDAAFLAAQYSTSRARDEVDRTGKDICSGRLHEIAMKVLGKECLKKLYKATNTKEIEKNLTKISTAIENNKSHLNPKKSTSVIINDGFQKVPNTESIPINKKSKKSKDSEIISKSSVYKSKSNYLNKERTIPEPDSPQPVALGVSEPVPSVVPVGMFKGPGSMAAPNFGPASGEESILPDDDEVCVIPTSSAESANTILSGILSQPQKDPPQQSRRNSRQLIVTSISSCVPKNPANVASSTTAQPKATNVTPKNCPIVLKNVKLKTGIKITSVNGKPTVVIPNEKTVIPNNLPALVSTTTSGQSSTPESVVTNRLPIESTKRYLSASPTTSSASSLTASTLSPKLSTLTPTKPAETISLDSDDEDVHVINTIKPSAVQAKAPVEKKVSLREKLQEAKSKIIKCYNVRKLLNNSSSTTSAQTITKPTFEWDKILDYKANASKASLTPRKDTELPKEALLSDDSPATLEPTNALKNPNVCDVHAKISASETSLTNPTVNSDINKTSLGTSVAQGDLKKDETSVSVKKIKAYKPKPRHRTVSTLTEPQTNLGMIDLTDLMENVDEPKNAQKPKPVAGKPADVTAPITGTSQNIYITKGGKLSTVKAATSSSSVDLTGGDVIDVIKITPTSSVKRPSPKPETNNPTKRKKVDAPIKSSKAVLSLSDFNFDDFDDIIELE